MAMHAVGQALVQQGRTEEGMSLLDEAMAGVVGGEGSDPLTVAQMSCMTMVVCGSCFDLERATQWVQSLERFMDRYGCPFLYAECRTYYGRVLFENGDWSAAEALLTEAISMSRGVFPAPHAFAAGTLAELRLAQGRIEDAVRVLRGVEGREEAAVAVASVHLERGEPSAAAVVLHRRLAATSPDRLDAAAVIELLGEAEIALAAYGAAIERGRTLAVFGAANNCQLIVAYGERLVGHALMATDGPAARTWRRRSRRSSTPGFRTAPRRRGCYSPRLSASKTVRWPRPRPAWRCRCSRIWGPAAVRTPPRRCCGPSA